MASDASLDSDYMYEEDDQYDEDMEDYYRDKYDYLSSQYDLDDVESGMSYSSSRSFI